MAIDRVKNFLMNLEGTFVGHYSIHGFEIVETRYSFNPITRAHILTATKITGDTYVPAGQITFIIEANSEREEILPMEGKGQVADYGFESPRFISGKLTYCCPNRTGFLFEFENCGAVIFLKRMPGKSCIELDIEEEMYYLIQLRDFVQTMSLDSCINENYKPGGNRSATMNDIQSNSEMFKHIGNSEEICTVCLSNFEEFQLCRRLSRCKHEFHAECIENWLTRCSVCPVCRSSVKNKE